MSTLTAPDRSQIERMVRSILEQQLGKNGTPKLDGHKPNLVVNISARHAHLTQADVDVLFGQGYQLTQMKRLYQDTDFASNETIAVVGPRQRMIPGVRILGPCRAFSQVELSITDAISLGLDIQIGRHTSELQSPC